MKKTALSVLATATMFSFMANEASAKSYEVQKGDSLWSIANKHQTSVSNLQSWNSLTNHLIYPKQLLEVDGASKTQPKSSPKPKSITTDTYTVKSGDTLSAIAKQHQISLATLMERNGIKDHLIYPGQILVISKTTTNNAPAIQKETVATPTNVHQYTIQRGDTLSAIAKQFGTTVNQLMTWNDLSSHFIISGQVLKVSGSTSGSSEQKAPATPAPTNDLISFAKSFMNTPYVWGGSTPAGFDCSGFIYYVFKETGHSVTRGSSQTHYNRSYYINDPVPGDLVFFENTYKAGISHVGIYIGENSFIHSGNNGVEITSLSNSYWKSKFASFKRFY
ncbi:C40 family peptidase [Bacillus sp. 2205SS5-2]|uniref:C40 family peptidase n=1 Tax=Bacillus sp. 2205SS5-2 TaxID=3109031 RepID=UPI003005B427